MALGGFTYGFGFSVFVTCEGQPGFYSDFSLDPSSTHTAHVLDAVNALFTAGAAFGSVAQSFIADKYGRRIGLGVAAVCALVGAALTAGSVNVPMMIVVRLLMGFGLGMVICLVPLYLSVSPKLDEPCRERFVISVPYNSWRSPQPSPIQVLTKCKFRSSSTTSTRSARWHDCAELRYWLPCVSISTLSSEITANIPADARGSRSEHTMQAVRLLRGVYPSHWLVCHPWPCCALCPRFPVSSLLL